MQWGPKLRRRFRLVFDRSAVEREMRDEIRFHLDMEAEELERFGATADAARTVAARRFGGVARYEDDARDARGGRWLEQLRQDTRYALRVLGRGRGFVAIAVLTLALGVGANTAIFSVVRGVLLRALPYPEPERLVAVQSVIRGSPAAVSPPDFVDWRAQAKSFSGLAAYFLSTTNLTGTGEPERLTQARVSANFFDILGVRPSRGRGFLPGEDALAAPRVAILSDGLWRRRFGADPSVVGRTIRLDDFPTTVIGIAPPELKLPVGVDLWLTTRFAARDIDPRARGARWIAVIGRLASGATLATARAEMDAIAERLALADPRHDDGVTSRVATLQEDLVGGVRAPLLILLGAVGFVMLIACVNMASLALGRTAARETELTVRVALGAGRGRIARQILTENLVLALGGGVAGLVLAVLGTRALVALAPGDLPLVHAVHVDGTVLSFSLAVTLLSGLAFGVVPALQGSRHGIEARLRAGSRGVSLGSRRLRRMLVVTEVALAITLLAGAGLLVRSLARLAAVDPGFRPDHVGTFSVTLSPVRYPDGPRQEQFARTLESRLAQLPGVTASGISFALPLTNTAFGFTFTIAGRAETSGPDEPRAQVRVVTPDYFRAMGIPIVRGRGFTARDDETAPNVILISQAAARRYWPNEDPIGQTLMTGWGMDETHRFGGTIIGVVGDVRQFSLTMAPQPEIYGPMAQRPLDELSVVMRSTIAPTTALAAARAVVRELDAELPVYDVRAYDDIVRESIAERRFYVTLLTTFAGLALVLAAIGIYGVIAYSVQQRRRELGIRIALGATRERVIGLVMRQGMTLTIIGAVIGLVIAAVLTRVLRGQLYEVSATDPLTFAVVPGILVVVALVACVVPARRAVAVDPATTIRAES
jgi:putative ABC transport system permease protein